MTSYGLLLLLVLSLATIDCCISYFCSNKVTIEFVWLRINKPTFLHRFLQEFFLQEHRHGWSIEKNNNLQSPWPHNLKSLSK